MFTKINTLFLAAQEFNFDTDESLLINLQNNTEFSTLVEALTLADLIDDLSLITSQSQVDVLADVLLNHVSFAGPYLLMQLECTWYRLQESNQAL